MELEHVKMLKKETEDQILGLLEKFENHTGLLIADVEITYARRASGKRETVCVKMEVKLP